MKILRSPNFWIGVAVGAIVVPIALNKFAPNLKAKIPGNTAPAQPMPQA
jgi:hypothetical protein